MGSAQDISLNFMSYLTLIDTILKFEKINWLIIDIPEIWNFAWQNFMQEPRVQYMRKYTLTLKFRDMK